MPIHKTVRNQERITEKMTMTIDDDWTMALVWNEDRPECSLLIESLDERFELVLYVSDREKLQDALTQFHKTLQELYIE